MVSQCARCGAWSWGCWHESWFMRDPVTGHRMPATTADYDAYTGARFCSEECRTAWEGGDDMTPDYVVAAEVRHVNPERSAS